MVKAVFRIKQHTIFSILIKSLWHQDEVYKNFKFQVSVWIIFCCNFTQDEEIVRFQYALLKLSLSNKIWLLKFQKLFDVLKLWQDLKWFLIKYYFYK